MATQQGVVSIEYLDQYGIPGTVDYFVTIDDTQTVGALISDVNTLGSDTNALTQAFHKSTKVNVTCFDNSATPSGVGDIEKGALLNFNNASDPYAQGYWIPDVNPAILNSNGLVDLTNGSVTAFITFLTTAHAVITVVTKGVRALTALRDALISFRKHRKPLARKTKEV